ncbi:MAG: 1-acyl-sn-glycerol-3-phosphate acyltransferase [Muribaculaceae bacterium]|nr:1-acyl-sn-glycerol-3-phosphate acyltransferase [Muribaculaceae bacterium]
MSLSAGILRLFGWKVSITVPDYPKCLICVAPHTSNWDFILGELAYTSVGRKAGFLMKETWFRWPLGYFFRAIGGIAVPRKRPGSASLTDYVIERFRSCDRLALAITPEGTRSRTSTWHTGFLHIALGAGVPIVLGAIDAPTKRIMIERTFIPTGDVEADMRAIKDFYAPYKGIHPEKFTTE